MVSSRYTLTKPGERASEIRFRAERRVGAMMADQRETLGLAQDKGIESISPIRARKYAAIPSKNSRRA